jgi:hypothetical protein
MAALCVDGRCPASLRLSYTTNIANGQHVMTALVYLNKL